MGCNCKDKSPAAKLLSIYEGFKNLAFPDPETEAKAKERAKICAGCLRSNHTLCKECGCYIPAKIRSNDSCPLGKWEWYSAIYR